LAGAAYTGNTEKRPRKSGMDGGAQHASYTKRQIKQKRLVQNPGFEPASKINKKLRNAAVPRALEKN
jgi:hypothetical protein